MTRNQLRNATHLAGMRRRLHSWTRSRLRLADRVLDSLADIVQVAELDTERVSNGKWYIFSPGNVVADADAFADSFANSVR